MSSLPSRTLWPAVPLSLTIASALGLIISFVLLLVAICVNWFKYQGTAFSLWDDINRCNMKGNATCGVLTVCFLLLAVICNIAAAGSLWIKPLRLFAKVPVLVSATHLAALLFTLVAFVFGVTAVTLSWQEAHCVKSFASVSLESGAYLSAFALAIITLSWLCLVAATAVLFLLLGNNPTPKQKSSTKAEGKRRKKDKKNQTGNGSALQEQAKVPSIPHSICRDSASSAASDHPVAEKRGVAEKRATMHHRDPYRQTSRRRYRADSYRAHAEMEEECDQSDHSLELETMALPPQRLRQSGYASDDEHSSESCDITVIPPRM